MFERLDGPNTPIGMVSPPSLATNDNSPLYEDEEEVWDKNGLSTNDNVVRWQRWQEEEEENESGKEQRWGGKGRRRLDRPNMPVGMVSPPSLAMDDNSPLYKDEEEDWDKNEPLMNNDVVSIERMTVVQVSIWIKIDNNNDDNNKYRNNDRRKIKSCKIGKDRNFLKIYRIIHSKQ